MTKIKTSKNGTYTLLLLGWLSVDPLADKYPGLSPYAYCANNPVMFVDPDGMQPAAVKALRMPKRIKALWNYWSAIRAAKVGGAVAGGWYLGNYLSKEELNTKAEEVINSITEGADQNNVNNKSQSSTSSSKTATASPDPNKLNESNKNENNDNKKGDNKKGTETRNMTEKEIGDFLDAGDDWHYNGKAKSNFVKNFNKQLKGERNPDFRINKNTKEVYLKPRSGKPEIPTGKYYNK